jgi:hypothetical protein
VRAQEVKPDWTLQAEESDCTMPHNRIASHPLSVSAHIRVHGGAGGANLLALLVVALLARRVAALAALVIAATSVGRGGAVSGAPCICPHNVSLSTLNKKETRTPARPWARTSSHRTRQDSRCCTGHHPGTSQRRCRRSCRGEQGEQAVGFYVRPQAGAGGSLGAPAMLWCEKGG